MWLIAVVDLATKDAESVLTLQDREVDELGRHMVGTTQFIRHGLGPVRGWLATPFALFGSLAGFGNGTCLPPQQGG